MRSCISFVCCIIASILVCTQTAETQKIRGTPGVDYPNYHTLPETSFKCSDQKYIPGFYADMETNCQVFHFCYNNRHESFLCPTGTTFNQPILACDSWFNSNCSLAPMFYVVNAGPGIEDASKNIPILMKLKDRAQGTFTAESVSRVSETNSIESVPEFENQSKDSDENINSDSATEKIPESKIWNEQELDSDLSTNADGADTSNFEEILNSESAGHLLEKEPHPLPVLRDEFILSEEEVNPEMNRNLALDPFPDVYDNRDYDASDAEWQESELPNQYQGFYDFNTNLNNEMIQNEESGQINQYQNFYKHRSNDRMQNEPYDNVVPEYLEDFGNVDEIPDYEDARDIENEFSKRYSSNFPKRSIRRRPAYVVIDETNFAYTGYDQNLYDVESTENPFAEKISIDDLVELNTQLPIEYEDNEDQEIGDKPNVEIPEMEDAFSADTESNIRLKSLASEIESTFIDRNEGEILDVESRSFLENNEGTLEDVNNREEQLVYSKDNLQELENQLEFSDDSAGSNDSDISPEEDDSFIIIPDSENDSSPEEGIDSEDSLNLSWDYSDEYRNENNGETEYAYQDVDGSAQEMDKFGGFRYTYKNINSNEQGDYLEGSRYEYEDTSMGDREMSELNGDHAYNSFEIHPQVQGYFNDPETLQFILQNYGYMSRPEALNSLYEIPDSHGMTNDGTKQYLDTPYDFGVASEHYNIPENLYPYGVSDETYRYLQENGYPYNPEMGYPYQNVYGDQYYEDSSDLPEFENVNDATEMPESNMVNNQVYSEQSSWNELPKDSINEEIEADFPFQDDGTLENLPEGRNFDVDSEEVDGEGIDEKIDETYYVFDFDENPEEMRETAELPDDYPVGTDSNAIEESKHENLKFEEGKESSGTDSIFDELSSKGESNDESRKVASDELASTFNDESGNARSGAEHMEEVRENAADSSIGSEESDISLETLLSQTLSSSESGEKAKLQRSNFIPAETQFLNTMAFPNTMGFSPYAYGANMGQQFEMIDSTNIPLSRTGNKVSDQTEKIDSAQLSRLSSLQEKIRSMKRGKFGMFKKYMNAMKKE